MSRSFESRTGLHARISAAYDRAGAAARLQDTLEAAGWDVDRFVTTDAVTVALTMPGRSEQRFTGPTALDALTLAVSWALGEGSEGGEA